MIERLSHGLVEFLMRETVVSREEADIYDYGFQITLANFINGMIVVLVGMAFHAVAEAAIFYCCFVSLRFYCGGYHADSYRKCFLLFTLTCMGCIGLTKWIEVWEIGIIRAGVFLGAAVWLGVSIFRKAPIADANRPASADETRLDPKRSSQLYPFWTGAGMILWGMGQARMQSCLISTFIAIAILMIQKKGGSERDETKRT